MPFKLDTNHIPFSDSFSAPANLYRGAPFWSWNGEVEKDELLRQIDVLKEMGMGGFYIHPRTGLSTEYLSDEFMDLVKACRDHAKAKGMLTCLYDEDRFPSGAAGGLVTENRNYRARHLLITQTPCGANSKDGELMARYAVKLEHKRLAAYRRLTDGEQPADGETVWYAYLEVARDSTWFNGKSYVDTLNPEAIQRFIEITHERYKATMGESFGTDIPAIFTDEPAFTQKKPLIHAEGNGDALLPWTNDLDTAFASDFGEPILDYLPEVIWDLPEGCHSVWRYRYHEWVAERFASSFADQVGDWCKKNGIAMTGHMAAEEDLQVQTNALGDAMRSYRAMQIPGIDMLCDLLETSTAKQAQSAARQYGRPGLMSELYGVTGWHFDFAGHKRQGDWQAALGVLFRVHHLSWYTMRGEAKRDYPASISYQSPWYKHYAVIEDHFARVAAVLSRGKPVCRVGVIHPIESFWLCSGPVDTSADQRTARQNQFQNTIDWLLNGTIDFDFIAESLLPDLNSPSNADTFNVGEMSYEVVVVPPMLTMRATTLERLEAFADAGGRIIFSGEIPSLVDAVSDERPARLAARCAMISHERSTLVDALEPHRDIEFRQRHWPSRPNDLFYQLRQEGDARYLFACNTSTDRLEGSRRVTLSIRGEYQLAFLDTTDGTQSPVAARYESGKTLVDVDMDLSGHILLKLIPGRCTDGASLVPPNLQEAGRMSGPVAITLDEPNVLLFDKAEYAIGEGQWQPEAQLLDIENHVRDAVGLPHMDGSMAQPWSDPTPAVELATVRLRATFESTVSVTGAHLALENLDRSAVFFDGRQVETEAISYFTDKSVATIAMPDFEPGQHAIEIHLSYTKETAIEWFYLLGDFGVFIEGLHGIVTTPVRRLNMGDWTTQGLPFYGGNVTYHFEATADGCLLRCPQFHGTALLACSQDRQAYIYRAPYGGDLPIAVGKPIDIALFGHRGNCFGPIHLAEDINWLGPNSYRTTGTHFAPESKLKPLGLMSSPVILAMDGGVATDGASNSVVDAPSKTSPTIAPP